MLASTHVNGALKGTMNDSFLNKIKGAVKASVPKRPGRTGFGLSEFCRIWPGPSLQAWLRLSLAWPGLPIGHIGFSPVA